MCGAGIECVLPGHFSWARMAVTNCISACSTLSPRITRGDKVALVDLQRVAALRGHDQNLMKLFGNVVLVKFAA